MGERSAGGRDAPGRYKRHDTARKVFIDTVAMPGLRLGKRVDPDETVPRLPPRAVAPPARPPSSVARPSSWIVLDWTGVYSSNSSFLGSYN